MRAPTVDSLLVAFPKQLTRHKALLIKRLARDVNSEVRLRSTIDRFCPETRAYASSCHNDPYLTDMWRTTIALHAINDILGTYGVESINDDVNDFRAPNFEYCNVGDPYATTLIYERNKDRLFIGNWGSIVEEMQLADQNRDEDY